MAFSNRLKVSRVSFPIVIVAVLVVAAGVYVAISKMNRHKLPAIDTAATVTPQGSYLDFTAIGIKIPLTTAVNDAVYAPFQIAGQNGDKVYGISSQTLIDTGNYSCAAAVGPLGLVIATTNPTVVTGANSTTQLTVDNKTVFKIGNTYYRYVPPQSLGCVAGSVTDNKTATAQTAFAQSFTSLQADSSITTTSTPSTGQ